MTLNQSQIVPRSSTEISQPYTNLLRPQLSGSSKAILTILAVVVLGILAIPFILIFYYILVIKCCLDRNRFGFFRNFFLSSSRQQNPLRVAAAVAKHGLDSWAIQSIPIVQYKDELVEKEEISNHCAVCLDEFYEGERMKVLPKCKHYFHIECVDTWLQSSVNCPLCRSSIRLASNVDPSLSPRDSPVLELLSVEIREHDAYQISRRYRRPDSARLLNCSASDLHSARKMEQQNSVKNKMRPYVSSIDDECIDVREKDDEFVVQPLRRSFSIDSSADRQSFHTVLQVRQSQRINISAEGGSNSSRSGGSSFIFGQNR